jgi:hypothetical protein
MKYTEAWSSVVSQNFNLKLVTITLALIGIILGMVCLKLSFKDAIIIERGCSSTTLQPVKDEHSKEEIENFLKAALSQRFDSEITASDGMLSPDELKLRDQEQKEFASRGIKQRVILNSVTETSDGFKVDTDRVISVGEIRSAFRFTLNVKLESKSRSHSNPYGLLVVTTKQLEDKNNSKKSDGR